AALSYGGVDLVRPQVNAGGPPEFRGAVLAPWSNRIGDGTYRFAGADHHLPINEPERGNALHGLVLDDPWQVARSAAESATLTVSLGPVDGYPFRLALRLTYALDEGGLTVTLEATNIGEHEAPYGCGFHPYVLANTAALDTAALDESVLTFEAVRRLRTDPDRLLPLEQVDVAGTAYDFSAGERIGARRLDDAFTDIPIHRLRVGDVRLWWGSALRWIQVFTPPERDALAVEPCTSPPDAFRTGVDLLVLAPGESHEVAWGIGHAPTSGHAR
ncbi:MAG: galactose mutarotase, partial [Actinomycetia bacterium]|nr:galactose mutarotase [Actinomycetes bacterium]